MSKRSLKKMYFVDYNGKYLASYFRITSALSFISRKHLRNDDENVLRIVDTFGDEYNPVTGKLIDNY